MNEILVGILTAFWLGLLTSISPCPLAANIAAISFLAKRIIHPGRVFLSGAFYTLGRIAAYLAVSFLIIHSLLSIPEAANFLQKYMNKILGPLLVVVGVVLLDFIKFSIPRLSLSEVHQNKLAESGAWGAFALGFIFALAFCPVSAGLFFGSLIPLALHSKLGILMPLVYGVGTGLPVLGFAVGIALGASSLVHWFRRVAWLEEGMRKVTGVVFIGVGLYYGVIYWFR